MSVPYNQLLLSDGEAGGIAKPTKLSRQQLITECLHCCRPLIHCEYGVGIIKGLMYFLAYMFLFVCSDCYGDAWSEVMETMAYFTGYRYSEVLLTCLMS